MVFQGRKGKATSAGQRVLLSRPFWVSAVLVLVSWLLLALGPSWAQSASFRSVDRNSDGVLTRGELIAAFGWDGADRLMRSTDHNDDGRITIGELRRGPDDDARDNGPRSPSSDNRDDDRDDDRDDGDDGDDGDD